MADEAPKGRGRPAKMPTQAELARGFAKGGKRGGRSNGARMKLARLWAEMDAAEAAAEERGE